MTDRVQRAFMESLLESPAVTRAAVARRVGVDVSMVSRWLKGDRNLRLSDALYLVERFGPRPLVEAGRAVGLTIDLGDSPVEPLEGPTGEVRVHLLAGLAAETARLAAELLQAPDTPEGRRALIQRVRALEELCQRAQRRLLSVG